MASYAGFGRSEDFTVKDFDALTAALDRFDVVIHPYTDRFHAPNTVYLLSGLDSGEWDFIDPDDESDDPESIFLPELIAEHLADGQVAIFKHVGAKKLRYLNAYAVAVHSDGRIDRVELDDVRTLAAATAASTKVAQ
ncbi:hypothetical protein [Gordonia sihwensis]|uniref:hypothetical protein n=1 Tax=Gordonia sihwensis TaxID=173559 RepID=UPI0012E0923F|nr:hypothetical protein [Gordonia sihwensis]